MPRAGIGRRVRTRNLLHRFHVRPASGACGRVGRHRPRDSNGPRGCGRLVLFAGPPGSGRTALLERARARASAQRLTVLAAGGEVGERDFPLAVARRLIEPAERYDALLELTRRLAAAAPAMVTVDDLHLCDVASVDWLGFVARRLRRHGIALVAGVDASETALISTLEETGARVLNLKPFSERAVAAWLRVERGQVVAAEIVRACHQRHGRKSTGVARTRSFGAGSRHARDRALALDRGWPRCRRRPDRWLMRSRCSGARPPCATRPSSRGWTRCRCLRGGPAARGRVAGPRSADARALPLVGRAVYRPNSAGATRADAAQAARLTGARPAEVTRHLLHSEPAADPWVETTLRGAARRALAQGEPGDATVLLCRAAREVVGGDRADISLRWRRPTAGSATLRRSRTSKPRWTWRPGELTSRHRLPSPASRMAAR